MANNTSQVGVLVLDTAADNIVASTVGVRVRKVKLVAGAAAAATATLCKAGGSVGVIGMAATTGATDTTEFYSAPYQMAGLQLLTISGAGATVYVYTEPA